MGSPRFTQKEETWFQINKWCKQEECNEVDKRWGLSTELILLDDPWKIKKELKESDVGNMDKLLLGRKFAEKLFK